MGHLLNLGSLSIDLRCILNIILVQLILCNSPLLFWSLARCIESFQRPKMYGKVYTLLVTAVRTKCGSPRKN